MSPAVSGFLLHNINLRPRPSAHKQPFFLEKLCLLSESAQELSDCQYFTDRASLFVDLALSSLSKLSGQQCRVYWIRYVRILRSVPMRFSGLASGDNA